VWSPVGTIRATYTPLQRQLAVELVDILNGRLAAIRLQGRRAGGKRC